MVSGNKELKDAINEWNQKQIHEFCLQIGIKWVFNPPTGSHHGGAWERCIRTARKIICALLQNQTVDEEGLTTLMCEVEAIINSRPLTSISDDSRDLEALTPNHILLLRSGPNSPPGDFKKHVTYSRRRWRHVQYLSDPFWKRWSNKYLSLLQNHQKWHKAQRNFRVGDIILVAQDNTHRSSWPLGRILETTQGRDGRVRKVKVLTRGSVLKRPISKCVLLEGYDPDQ